MQAEEEVELESQEWRGEGEVICQYKWLQPLAPGRLIERLAAGRQAGRLQGFLSCSECVRKE